MANSLLDFVMSLVRDPDAAARYAQDPAQAIADAHLTDVTSADVNHLIPVVSESLSVGGPGILGAAAADANVWASGAATAAFDAFADPMVGMESHSGVVDHLVAPLLDTGTLIPDQPLPDLTPLDLPVFDEVLDLPIDDLASPDASVSDHSGSDHSGSDHSGFDPSPLDAHWHTSDDGGFFH